MNCAPILSKSFSTNFHFVKIPKQYFLLVARFFKVLGGSRYTHYLTSQATPQAVVRVSCIGRTDDGSKQPFSRGLGPVSPPSQRLFLHFRGTYIKTQQNTKKTHCKLLCKLLGFAIIDTAKNSFLDI